MEYIEAKTIVSGYAPSNPWFGMNYNMNIYKGCCHGCIYCDSRSECYRVENFDTVRAKENALETIERDLRKKTRTGIVGTGAMSDPYNPFERQEKLTAGALELIEKYDFGVGIATKSDLITRDIPILQKIQANSPVICKITVTAASDEICAKIEPNVARASQRFNAVRELSRAGIFTGILLMPILPFITDSEENIMQIVEQAHESGAKFIFAGNCVTLRQNQREHFYKKLDETFPEEELAQKYRRVFGDAYVCKSPQISKLWLTLERECKKRGILYKMKDIIAQYKSGFTPAQQSFF